MPESGFGHARVDQLNTVYDAHQVDIYQSAPALYRCVKCFCQQGDTGVIEQIVNIAVSSVEGINSVAVGIIVGNIHIAEVGLAARLRYCFFHQFKTIFAKTKSRTVAPWLASFRLMALPIPDPPPGTKTVFPANARIFDGSKESRNIVATSVGGFKDILEETALQLLILAFDQPWSRQYHAAASSFIESTFGV